MSDTEAGADAPAAEAAATVPEPAAGETSHALTLSQQTNQVENDSPIKDPDTTVPDNLVMMEEMTKEKLLEACKERFNANGVYTFVADILVALNPYQWIDMYGKQYKERYNPAKALCGVPHVYACAQRAAKNLRLLHRDQVCIVSGESGSGKTETAKLFMHHLLTFSDGGAGHSTQLEKQILESQPLLEAFGNAKTGLNDNSSRFGKYIEVMFEGMDKVLGAGCRKYLLEKSRVISQVAGERNFHVFYYLTEGAPAALKTKLKLNDSSSYKYLQLGETVEDPSVWFNELDRSLRGLGFDEESIMSLYQSVAAIIKTGQIEFTDNHDSTDDSCSFSDKSVAQDLADTLCVSLEKLENAMTTKHVVSVGETFHKPLNAAQSTGNRDTLAQNMYDNLFSWLVDQINEKLASPKEGDWRSVAVLDIFGFENFKSNEFEQMFINTANERLQQYFIDHIFTYELKELKEEGIRCPKVEYTTNTDQVELLLGDRGIFALLDEQTKVPNSDDASTIVKMHSELSSNPSYDHLRKSPRQFAISHYAGVVKYEAIGLLEKNRNAPSLGISGMMKSSTNPVIASLFKASETTDDRLQKDLEMRNALKSGDVGFMRRQSQIKRFGRKKEAKKEDDKPKKKLAPWQIANMRGKEPKKEEPKKQRLKRQDSDKRRAGLTTLSSAFKGSLDALMEMLHVATPHFVRCIKPNMTKTAKKFDGPIVQKQLNYTGVLETTKIRQNGYPLRVTFEDFVDRYRDVCIPPTYRVTSAMAQSTTLQILQKADLHGWGKGKTKMFLKYEHINVLVDILEGKKRAANEARAKAAAEQAKKDAELAEIERKREIERAKIRAAAEAQPQSKAVASSLNWQEEMKLAKQKKKEAAEKKKREEEEAAKAAAEAEKKKAEEDEGSKLGPKGSVRKSAGFGAARAMFQ